MSSGEQRGGVGGDKVMRIIAHINEWLLEPGIVLNTLNLLICLILTMTHYPNFTEGKLGQGLSNLPTNSRQSGSFMLDYML